MTRPITIGDVLRAFRELGATSDVERRAIARLLGYDLLDALPEASAASQVPEVLEPPPREAPRPSDDHKPAIPDEPGAPVTEVLRLPDIVRNPVELPEPIGLPEIAPSPPATPPLFNPVWSPAILVRLGARPASVGAIDVPRLIPDIARRTPLRSLPRGLRLVTAPTIAVVLDVSGTMPWLAEDQAALLAELRATLRAPIDAIASDGPPRIAEPGARPREADDDDAEHAGEPTGEAGESAPAVRVDQGTRVLALTDLGAGSSWTAPARDRAVAWRAFASDLGAHGASLVLLTPVPAARRPAEVRDLACVHWHHRTRPSQVHALVRQLR